jgi:hypothetical protein
MNLYQIVLPLKDNSGHDVTPAHRAFQNAVLSVVPGLTKMPQAYGLWDDRGERYIDRVVPYQIACSSNQWRIIVGHAFRLFPDQLAIFHAQLGTAEIEYREKKTVAA